MKYLCFLPLLALAVHGFLPAAPSSATCATTTELNALGLRTTKRFISRRILRRKPKHDTMEVVMRQDEDAAVKDGAPTILSLPKEQQESKDGDASTTAKVVADSQGGSSSSSSASASSSAGPLTVEAEQRIIASIAAANDSNSKSNAELLAQTVDDLFFKGEPQQAKDLLLKEFTIGVDVEESGPLYWRLIKAEYELFCNTKNNANLQLEHLEKGIALVEEVCPSILEADVSQTTQAYLLKWKAILLGKLGTFQSTKEKMSNSFIIKDSLEQAQALLSQQNQEDSSIYQALGEWCFKVANISFLERQAASVLFGKPPKATYEEALEYFQKGYDLKATPALATKLAETHQKMGQSTQAEEWFAKAKQVEQKAVSA